MGPLIALNFISELTKNQMAHKAMLDKNDFYFMVVANPDGYVYTWEQVLYLNMFFVYWQFQTFRERNSA